MKKNGARSDVRGWFVAAALCGLSVAANAIGRFPDVVQVQRSQSIASILKKAEAASPDGVTQALMAASPGTRYLPGMGGFTMAGNYGVAPGAIAGSVKAASDVAVNVAGKNVGVQVAGTIGKADIAAAVVGCVSRTLVGCAASAIPLAVAYFSVSGARVKQDGTGLEIVPTGDAWCYSGPCYAYHLTPMDSSVWVRGLETACRAWIAAQAAAFPNSPFEPRTLEGVTMPGTCITRRADGSVVSFAMQRQQVSPLSPTWHNTTPQEVTDKLIADNAANPPIGIVPELEKAGIDWNASWKSPSVVGPAEVKGPESVTQNPDGSTTTKQSTTPLSYSGPTVTAGPTTETTIKRNSSGTEVERSTTTTTTGDEATPQAKEEEDPPTQCDKYPDTLGCADLGTPEAQIPKADHTITYAPENPFGGGSCPSDKSFVSQLAARSFTAWDWGQTCSYVATYVRPLIILLATIAAFFIVSLGRDEQ